MWQNAGIPVQRSSFPTEGSVLYISGMVVPKNASNKAGRLQIPQRHARTRRRRLRFAERMGYRIPTVDNTKLEGKVAEQLALPDHRLRSMHPPNYEITGKLQGADLRMVEEERCKSARERFFSPLASGRGRDPT